MIWVVNFLAKSLLGANQLARGYFCFLQPVGDTAFPHRTPFNLWPRAGTFPFPQRPLCAPAPMHDTHYCLWLTGHKFHKSFSLGLIGQTLKCYSLDAKTLRNTVPLAPGHPASESANWFIGGESQWSALRSSQWKCSKSSGRARHSECECPMTSVDVPVGSMF